jgi:hypothetical protein
MPLNDLRSASLRGPPANPVRHAIQAQPARPAARLQASYDEKERLAAKCPKSTVVASTFDVYTLRIGLNRLDPQASPLLELEQLYNIARWILQ